MTSDNIEVLMPQITAQFMPLPRQAGEVIFISHYYFGIVVLH